MFIKRSAIFLAFITVLVSCTAYNDPRGNAADDVPIHYDRRSSDVALKDEDLEIKTRETLNNDPDISSQSHINVNAYNGTLLLTGQTPDIDTHSKITAKVSLFPNVKRVLDEIEIAPETHPASHYNDGVITNRIRTELDTIQIPPGFKSQNIKIFTENGHVYLMGLVYREEADIVTKVTQQVAGVREITKLFEYLR